MSDATTPPPGDAPADRGPVTPDARGESALGTGHGSGAHDTTGLRAGADSGTRGGDAIGAPGSAHTPGSRLLSHDESDKFALRLQHAVAGFVDAPHDSVEEADHVLEEIADRFTDAVTRRRRTLRMSWQSADVGEDEPATATDTEQLRLALRDYRELAERLLHM